jgi:hypothetical protein
MHVTYAYLHRAAEASAAIAPKPLPFTSRFYWIQSHRGSLPHAEENSWDISASNHHENPDVIRAVIDQQQDHVVVFRRSMTFSAPGISSHKAKGRVQKPTAVTPAELPVSFLLYEGRGGRKKHQATTGYADFLSSSFCVLQAQGC